MPKSLIVFLIIFLSFTHSVNACSCESEGPFLTVAQSGDLVALVRITKYLSFREIQKQQIPMSMEAEIISIYKGTENRKTIKVWGDYGHLCRPYLSHFDSGSFYVISFFKGRDGKKGFAHPDETSNDYYISICGDYWLSAYPGTQTAAGSVSRILGSIRFGELIEFFNGNFTKALVPEDFKSLFQQALDINELQTYFHTDSDSTRKQIYFQFFGDADHDSLKKVVKFGKHVKLLSEEEIKKAGIKYYFTVADWICNYNSVRLQLEYFGEGLTISFIFRKINGAWKIESYDLTES